VRIATIGDIGANLAKFDVGDRQVPIRVQLDERARADRQTLESLKVPTASGATVPLSAVARFELAQGPTAIDRYDRMRRVLVGADLVGNAPLGKAVDQMLALPAAKTLPAGVEVKQFGDAEIMGEVFAGFAAAMSAGIMMVYAVLVLLFGSFLQPITILFSLPLSIGGAIVALAVTGQAISLPVVIGILMLMGIVTKNAIMLVDFAIEEMRRGTPRTDAIVDAGRKRARPIVMTTIAMVAGMMPAAIGLDSGGEFRAPMSIAVIGGLLSSTLLSLVFVPAVFAVMDDIGRLAWRIFGRFVGPTEEPTASSAATVPAEPLRLPAAAE
jgi:multidrug efflux pump subunit AcrB